MTEYVETPSENVVIDEYQAGLVNKLRGAEQPQVSAGDTVARTELDEATRKNVRDRVR